MSRLSILVVEHEDQCPPGWMGKWLVDAGATLDVRRPYAGDPLPDDLTAHAGMVVLGGEVGAHDDAAAPWLTDVKRLVRGVVQDEVDGAAPGPPVLGICLGHQLIAVALGGDVEVNPLGQQIGVLDVGWTPAAHDDPLLGLVAASSSQPVPAVQWNNDVVTDLPAGAVPMAWTGRGELQAARFTTNVWGVQWHPEVSVELLRAWADHDRDDALERGVDLERHLADVAAAHDRLRAAWRPLADRFTELCVRAAEGGRRPVETADR